MKKYFFSFCLIGNISISMALVSNNPKIQSLKGFLYYKKRLTVTESKSSELAEQ